MQVTGWAHAAARAVAAAGFLCVGGAPLRAQAYEKPPAHLATLAVPPGTVGTCLPAPAYAPDTLRGHHLVMTDRPSAGRREITAFTDRRGRVLLYTEMADYSTKLGASTGSNVMAFFAPDGRVNGRLLRMTTTMDLPPLEKLDVAGVQRAREQAKSTRKSESLSPRDQARAREVAAWLVRRCPG